MCGGGCSNLINAKELLEKEPREIDTILFDMRMLVMEMNNSIKKEDKPKVYEDLKRFMDIYFGYEK
jgi:hypothetical protein